MALNLTIKFSVIRTFYGTNSHIFFIKSEIDVQDKSSNELLVLVPNKKLENFYFVLVFLSFKHLYIVYVCNYLNSLSCTFFSIFFSFDKFVNDLFPKGLAPLH